MEGTGGWLHFTPPSGIFLPRMRILLALGCTVLVLSCEPGLSPPPDVEPGFGGTVYFERATWPPADSLYNLWIFASQVYPLDSVKIFAGLFSTPPTIFLYPGFTASLPFFVDSLSYAFNLPAATYQYVGVLQQFRDEISVRSLRVVGVHGAGTNPSQPLEVRVDDFQFLQGVNIRVNFHKLPPQPF